MFQWGIITIPLNIYSKLFALIKIVMITFHLIKITLLFIIALFIHYSPTYISSLKKYTCIYVDCVKV